MTTTPWVCDVCRNCVYEIRTLSDGTVICRHCDTETEPPTED